MPSNPGTLAATTPAQPNFDAFTTPTPVPVIDVTVIATGARVTINASDFNAALHSSPSKPRTPAIDLPGWQYLPQNGGSIAIQVTLISGGATAVIWSSQFNASLHSNPQYMANIQTADGYGSLNANQYSIPTPTFGNGMGMNIAYNVPGRALQPWPSAWPLPSIFKSDFEVQGGSPALT